MHVCRNACLIYVHVYICVTVLSNLPLHVLCLFPHGLYSLLALVNKLVLSVIVFVFESLLEICIGINDT